MITLGIESTAHTLGIGVVKNGSVLSNVIDTYRPKNEGLFPRKVADHHSEVFQNVLTESLRMAKLTMDDIDLISFSQGPGIGAPLRVGLICAKYLAARYKKNLIGVNHGFSHLKISEHITKIKSPLILYVSGGNTQIIVENAKGFQVLGETLDIGVGNLYDSFGRTIGLEYAHGSSLSSIASTGKYVELPYSVKGMNLVFTGLLTHAEKLYKDGVKKEDLAYSLFETSFSMICEATERALFLTKKKGLVVCGGVAQNRRLQEMLRVLCSEAGVKFGVAPDEFNRDNGAMIAYAGEILFRKHGTRKLNFWKPIQNYRLEMVSEMTTKYSKSN